MTFSGRVNLRSSGSIGFCKVSSGTPPLERSAFHFCSDRDAVWPWPELRAKRVSLLGRSRRGLAVRWVRDGPAPFRIKCVRKTWIKRRLWGNLEKFGKGMTGLEAGSWPVVRDRFAVGSRQKGVLWLASETRSTSGKIASRFGSGRVRDGIRAEPNRFELSVSEKRGNSEGSGGT